MTTKSKKNLSTPQTPAAQPVPIEHGLYHVVTVGTTPPTAKSDVVDALIADLKGCRPELVIVVTTESSRDNATRLFKGLGIRGKTTRVHVLSSAQSLEEAYQAANEELDALIDDGVAPEKIMLHYTAGTKVMSAGAVMAALNHDIRALRYLFSKAPSKPSIPVTTATSAVLGDKRIRFARTLLTELRFRSCMDVLNGLDNSLLTEEQSRVHQVLLQLAPAYEDWDRFRVKQFLDVYEHVAPELKALPELSKFPISEKLGKALCVVVEACESSLSLPEELILDIYNNAIRRLAERRPDDALIRLFRVAELYAQSLLLAEYKITTDDVEIRKVLPRSRPIFEAERRMEDAKIKIGLRKSYELLAILGHPIGEVYRTRERFRDLLNERRRLVLGHGTRPATLSLALEFLDELDEILSLSIKNLRRRAQAQQFPWIDNKRIRDRIRRTTIDSQTAIISTDE